MPKKTKKHVIKPTGEKKVPRISVMEKEKKGRQKLYLFLSIGAVIVLGAGIAIGAILGGGNKAPQEKTEIDNGHFTQVDGYFEMDVPKAWGFYNTAATAAPYGMDKVPHPYAFFPTSFKSTEQKSDGTTTANPSPNNILFTIVPKDYSTAEVENFLTDQNVLADPKIVEYLRKSAQVHGRQLKSCPSGWVLGEKPEQKVTSGSFVGYIKTAETEIFFTSKYTDKENQEEILKSLDSLKVAKPASLDAYTGHDGSFTIPRPEGWVIDTESQTLMVHRVNVGQGAVFYPEGTKTTYSMSPEEIQATMEKSGQNDNGKQVVSSASFPVPLYTYMAVYDLGKNPDAKSLNAMFLGMIGFQQDLGVSNAYDWMVENIAKKGLSMANCPGKYFISEKPVKIMQVKPKQSLFATIETKSGTVLIMAGWTNDQNQKAIIDTLNKIKLTAK